jgi:hypothetical protein
VPQEEPPTSASPGIKFNITNWVSNVMVLVPLIELANVPSVYTKLKELLGMGKFIEPNQVIDTNEDSLVVLQVMTQEGNKW